MNSDPIVAEIRAFRERRAARFGFDIRAIVKDAQQRDAADDRKVVRRAPRSPIVATSGDRAPRGNDLEQRAAHASKEKYHAVLAKVPRVEPDEDDKLDGS